MMLPVLVLVFVQLFLFTSSLKDVPEYARNGQYWATKKSKHLTANPYTALTWNAPVDHFNQTNTATFKQR